MRAILVTALGGPEVLVPTDVPAPVPGPGEVLIQLGAIGVNFADTERRRGAYARPTLPWIPGHEGGGTIAALGDGVDRGLLGMSVGYWSRRSTGSYAQRAAVPVEDLFEWPAGTPAATMAALPLQGLTAYGVVHFAARVRAGETVLVHGAAGGVGQLAVQLAIAAGARVLGTGSTAAKQAAIAGLGAEPLAYGDDLATRITARCPRGVDVVLDAIGRDTQAVSRAVLAPFGRLVYFGEASGAPAPINVDDLYERSLAISAFGLDLDAAPARWAEARAQLIAAVQSRRLILTIAPAIPLTEAARAHVALEGRATIGKLVLDPDR
jgi:NADPH2:quinone reductase